MISTPKAWGLRTEFTQPTAHTQCRPYWIEPPVGRSRDLTDEEIRSEFGYLDRYDGMSIERCIEVVHRMEAAQRSLSK